MASKEEATQPLNYKTCVLKVSIHCEGCKKKVKKILKNINGVLSVDIDAPQNKVTVAGDVDTDTLIRRLAKSGKNADTWPVKKPANPNPKPNLNTKPKEKNKAKESEPAAKEIVAAAVEKTPAATSSEPAAKPAETATDSEPAVKPAETATKPAETATKPAETTAEPAKKEAAESSRKEEAAKPDKKPEKEPADTKPDTDTKPAETSVKTGGSGKKKGKKPEEQWEGHSGNSTRNLSPPAYQVPVYAVSHNTAQPMPSHSYYYAPAHSTPQSYAHPYPAHNYSQPQPPPPPQQPEYYPPGNYSYDGSDNYYGTSSHHSYSYYGSTDPRASPSRYYPSQGQGQGELDMFNDENANSCSVM